MAKTKELDIAGNTTPVEAPHISKTDKEASKEMLDKFKEQDLQMVKGRFRNIESPGGSQTIPCRKYAGHFFQKTMTDGQIYEIPRYVANWLNGFDRTATKIDGQVHSCSYAVSGFATSKDGFPTRDLDAGMTVPLLYKRRYAFESLEFEKAM